MNNQQREEKIGPANNETAAPDEAIRLLEERLQFGTLMSDLSAAIVNAAADAVHATIQDALRQVAGQLDAEACALFEFSASGNRLRRTHVHDGAETRRRSAEGEFAVPADLLTRLRANDLVEWGGESNSAQSTEPVDRWLLIPVHVGGVPGGALGCLTCGKAMPRQPYVLQRLRLLGDIIANTLSRTQTAAELVAAKTRFALAVAGSTDGIWDWNLETCEFFYSDRCLELVGLHNDDFDPATNTFNRHIHPDDVEYNRAAITKHLKERQPYDVEYRLLTRSGKYRWFRSRGQAVWDDDGRALRMAGSIQDIDAQKQAQAALANASKPFISVTGDALFQSVTRHLAESLEADYAFIGLLEGEDPNLVTTKAVFEDGRIVDNFTYNLKDTPCDEVIRQLNCVYPSGVQQRFPNDVMLAEMGIEAYMGTTLVDVQGQPRGLAGLLFRRPLAETQAAHSTLKIVARHISAELERHRAQDALLSSEQRIRRIFDLGVIGMAISTPDKKWIDVNDRLCEIVGYTAEELVSMSWVDISHPDEAEIDNHHFQRVLAGEIDGFTRDKRYVTKSGRTVDVSIAINCARAADGSVEYLFALIQDISDRKHAERALHASEQHLRAIIDTTPACVKLHTREGILLEMNTAGLSIVGAESFEEVCGRNVYDLITEEYHPLYRDFVDRVCSGERGMIEFEIVGLNGKRRYMESRAVRLKWHGESHVILAITNDITARKEADRFRETLIQELESKNTELERFTYTVSHDLKSPLVTIKGFLGLLQKDLAAGDLPAVEDDWCEIDAAADKMEQLLDGLLKLSRVGRIANPSEEVEVGELVAEALRMSAGGITQKGVNVTVAPQFPAIVGDRLRLLEVMQNLIDNAVRHCSATDPQIEIGVQQDDGRTVCFVRNNGTGIEPEYHDRVFTLFEQLDVGGMGTGIGLTIVQRVLEVHGGNIWIESAGGQQGCTFKFWLPWQSQHGTI